MEAEKDARGVKVGVLSVRQGYPQAARRPVKMSRITNHDWLCRRTDEECINDQRPSIAHADGT
jgi:hypothetical protein